VTIGSQRANVLCVGAQPNFTGIDQINVKIPVSLAGSGPWRVKVVLTFKEI